jgi:hypothetical protein
MSTRHKHRKKDTPPPPPTGGFVTEKGFRLRRKPYSDNHQKSRNQAKLRGGETYSVRKGFTASQGVAALPSIPPKNLVVNDAFREKRQNLAALWKPLALGAMQRAMSRFSGTPSTDTTPSTGEQRS